MGMVEFMFNPAIFAGVFTFLLVIAIFVALSSMRQENKYKKLASALQESEKKKNEFELQVKQFQEEMVKFKDEIAVKNQMYEGLKGQYNELEKEMERRAAPQVPDDKTAHSVTNILKDLQRLQDVPKQAE